MLWALWFLAAAALVVCAHTALAGETNIRESPQAITLWTDDGLVLEVRRTDGALCGIRIGEYSRSLRRSPLLRFEEVLPVAEAPDLFAGAAWPESWGVPSEAAMEDGWVHVPGDAPWRPSYRVELNQTEATPLVLTASCRADFRLEANGWYGPGLAANVSGMYADGEPLPYQSAYFGQYTHPEQVNSRIICPDAPLEALTVSLDVPRGPCDAWFRDVSLRPAAYRIVSPTSECERLDARVQQEFTDEDAGLRSRLTLQPLRDALEIRCQFTNTEPHDRAISAFVAVPLDAVGGVWWDDLRRSRPIQSGRIYRNVRWYGAGRDGYESRYPLACVVTPDGEALCLGVAVDEPRVFCIEYDSRRRELRVRFDLGLSPDAGSWANRGSFTAYLFRSPAADGFRGAAERFHHLHPWAFLEKRAQREGLWIAFVSPQGIPGGPEGLHFQFVEAAGNMGWDEAQGLTSMKYAEPWILHQESSAHEPLPEASGPVDPAQAIALARRLAAERNRDMLPDYRQRYPAYLGSHITDQWGSPQGYYFRSPAGRNENMMIVNPDPRLPPAAGADFSFGAYDLEVLRETAGIWKQWSLEGWCIYRCSERPGPELDPEVKHAGYQSVRFDPIRSKGYWEQHVRGMSQTVYCQGMGRVFHFGFWGRVENAPPTGPSMRWTLEFISANEKTQLFVVDLAELTRDWTYVSRQLEVPFDPLACQAVLVNLPWYPDPTRLWIDEVTLSPIGSSNNLLVNGGFESAQLLPARLDAYYLDTIECYEANLNHRREHWPYSEAPPTFDESRRPALHQLFSHAQFVRRVAELAHREGRLVFGNCVPVSPFVAPWLDILGNEEFWALGGRWTPKSDEAFLFSRFMSRAKPSCILQYNDLDAEQVARYVKRCLFYGVYPGNQSSSTVSGKWYWTNPVRVNRDRPTYARYLPFIQEISQAGWEPLTLATAEDPALWVERFGEGAAVYLTAFNPTDQPISTRIVLDTRLPAGPGSQVVERLTGKAVPLEQADGELSFPVTLESEDVAVFRITLDDQTDWAGRGVGGRHAPQAGGN